MTVPHAWTPAEGSPQGILKNIPSPSMRWYQVKYRLLFSAKLSIRITVWVSWKGSMNVAWHTILAKLKTVRDLCTLVPPSLGTTPIPKNSSATPPIPTNSSQPCSTGTTIR